MRSGALLAVLALSSAAVAQRAEAPLSRTQKAEVVEAAAGAYADYYVFADKGRLIASELRRGLSAGSFDAANDRAAFAAALTNSIRAVTSDRHIEIVPPPPTPAARADPSRAEELGWIERLRRRNYDFVRVERLPGNIGYLRLDSFPPPELAADTAAAAMKFLENSDALIFDLRENGGGTGDMVRLLASYLFAVPTRLLRVFRRSGTPQTSYDLTLPSVAGKRLPVIDVFVLTSAQTNSAAESFAFSLQQAGRARVIGEVTRGAANAGDYVDLRHGFVAFVPDVHVSSPTNDASWEGVGVRPDVPAAAGQALAVAHREALRRLLAAASDAQTRESLRRALDARPK